MKNTPRFMFFFGIVTYLLLMLAIAKGGFDPANDEALGLIFRVLTALAASAISISIPGMIQLNYTPKGDKVEMMTDENEKPVPHTLAEKETAITASGAIAIFVLVYLFNPI